ncbi:MAG: hypothetical protein HY231_15895 [Acidobacteria bacterium]|nr:hypothetical protein [Acidobacteriota bacterium]
MKYIAYLMIGLLFVPTVFANPSLGYQSPAIDETYSFENDFEGWGIRATEFEPDLPPPVTRSQERATDGVTSLRIVEGRRIPFQIVWVEKVYTVEATQSYDVIVDYDFASRDCCSANSLALLTGVSRLSPDPTKREQLGFTGQGPTGDDNNTSGEYKWYKKRYEFAAHTDEQGKLYVLIGIGAGEFGRPYFFDNIHIKIARRSVPCEFFSFENELEGWTPKAIDVEAQGTTLPWSVTRSQQFFQDGKNSAQFEINSSNGKAKVWIERAFTVEPGRKYRVNVEYGFFSQLDVRNSTLITGVLRDRPESAADLELFYQEDTGKPGSPWKRKQYQFTAKSKKSSTLYVVIGIFASQQGVQLYYFDNVCISISAK